MSPVREHGQLVRWTIEIFTHKEQTKSSAKTIRIEETQRLGYGLRLLGEYTLRGFRPSVRKEATWGTALHSNPLVWTRDQSQVSVKLLIVYRNLIGSKKGGG